MPIIQRPCDARLIVFYDDNKRVAIIIPVGLHNHPSPSPQKLTDSQQTKYRRAISAHGILGATVSKVDQSKFILFHNNFRK